MLLCVSIVSLLSLFLGAAPVGEKVELTFAECPAPVRKTLQAEAKGAKIETVAKEKNDDGKPIYWADVDIGETTYAIGVLEDGTLTEMNLAIDEKEVALDRCPAAVQETFRREAFGENVKTVGKDRNYGVMIYETVVQHQGKSYELVVAEDGTLVEKVLVIDDEEVALSKCPALVQAAFRAQAKGGGISEVTRSTGITGHTYEAEIEIRRKIYVVEVSEKGVLISKSLEADEE